MDNELTTTPEYSEILRTKGRSLESIGSKEIALTRTDMLQALRVLKEGQVAILGGSVLRVVDGVAENNFDGWHCKFRKNKTFNQYAQKSWKAAWDYIQSYPDSENGTFLYTITLADETWLSEHNEPE